MSGANGTCQAFSSLERCMQLNMAVRLLTDDGHAANDQSHKSMREQALL